ncbi:MAG TPA: hypothetical protein VGR15_09365 [Bacteroidota bacterium]|jgi:hypothetical protein|nr:hypothetical protein [Bacteroidota bacterium]
MDTTSSPDDGKIITREQAKSMILKYQGSTDLFNSSGATKGGFYGRNKILSILNQANCIGLRYYYALNASNQLVIALVGEDRDGNVMSGGTVINEGPLCPPVCGTTNFLDE